MVAIAEVMTADPVCVRAKSTLRFCLRELLRNGIRHLPVVDDAGRLVGLLYDFQVLRYCDRRRTVPVVRHEHAEVPAVHVAVSAGHIARPESRLLDALDRLLSGWEDAVVIVDEERHPVGVFTVADAIGMARSWLTPWWRVRQAMRPTEDALAAHTPVADALQLMWNDQRAHALVIDGDHLIGTVSLRELVAHDPKTPATVADLQRGRIRAVGPDTSLVDAAWLLARSRRGSLPVLVHDRPRGLFTEHDVVRALRRTVNVATTQAS